MAKHEHSIKHILNPKSKRYVLKTGIIGKTLIQQQLEKEIIASNASPKKSPSPKKVMQISDCSEEGPQARAIRAANERNRLFWDNHKKQ